MKKLLLLSISAVSAFLLFSCTAWAACHVITSTGSGTKTGSDWNNACAGFSGNCSATSMIRGDSYYIAAGGYSSPNLSTSNSGSTPITIKAATSADHCTSTGFQSSHIGQADLAGQLTVSSDYWIVDGQYGTPFSKGSYGIKIHWTSNGQNEIQCDTGCNSSTFRYLEIQGSNAGSSCSGPNSDAGIQINGYNHSGGSTGVTVDHDYFYQNNNAVKYNSTDNGVVQYSVLSENYSSSSCHGEPVAMNDTSNLQIRYNRIVNCAGTACISDPCGTCVANVNVQIYGNVLYDDLTRPGPCVANGGSYPCLSLGLITNTGSTYSGLKVYNNTIANFQTGRIGGNTLGFYVNSAGNQSGLDFRNNLFYNNAPVDMDNSGSCSSNSYYSTVRNSGACTGDQTGTIGNPFVRSSGSGLSADFRLVADTTAWASLSSPFNVDPVGTSRTSSRGAFQFGSPTSQGPSAPSALSAFVQ
jgi:hypothetical protein